MSQLPSAACHVFMRRSPKWTDTQSSQTVITAGCIKHSGKYVHADTRWPSLSTFWYDAQSRGLARFPRNLARHYFFLKMSIFSWWEIELGWLPRSPVFATEIAITIWTRQPCCRLRFRRKAALVCCIFYIRSMLFICSC